MATSLLDLVGVLLIGLVGALAVTTVQSQPPPEIVESAVAVIGLQDLTSQELILVLAIAAAAVLLAKSLLSTYLTRRVFMFLANRQALVSARLSKELLSRPLTFIQSRSSQQTAYALITGAGAATMQVLGQVSIIAAESALLVFLAGALMFVSPVAALCSIAYFALVAFLLQLALGSWASSVGRGLAAADIASLDAVQEALGAYREILVSDRRGSYVTRIQRLRWQAAKVAADAQFIGVLPKYIFEAALVLGGFALAAALFATQSSVSAVATLALFLAAATRVMPSLLRLQSASLGLRSAAGNAAPTFELADALGNPTSVDYSVGDPSVGGPLTDFSYPGFEPSISLSSVTITYPKAVSPSLRSASVFVPAGSSVALVGRSGSGKSTMADIMLGVLQPDSGEVRLGGTDPATAIQTWPGSVSYVPQDVVLANTTIRANVALGVADEVIDDALVWEALDRAHLADQIRYDPAGIYADIGERGVRLSGGQRQRLGIARALYTRPKLIVLDEATSALDAETELAISEMLQDLEGHVTTVVIAHRISTVREVDQLIYLSEGEVVSSGSFTELVESVPAFRNQARLMGLIN